MTYKVIKIISDLVIVIEGRWKFRNMTGSYIKIKGLLPSDKQNQKLEIEKLKIMLLNNMIEIVQPLYVAGNTLSAIIKYNGKYVQDSFEDRKIPTPQSRLSRPEEYKVIRKVTGGIPKPSWVNPISTINSADSPFFGNISYPVRPWDKDFSTLKLFADRLYTDSHYNKFEIDRWFNKFLSEDRREAPVLIVGQVGMGKSWMLANKLMNLPADKYHVIIIDLRNSPKGERLEKSIEYELNEFLNYYIKDISYMYPDFQSIYGDCFNPNDPQQRKVMQDRAASLDVWEHNRRRLRYYGFPNSPELIILFDNIDHYSIDEQEAVVQICKGLYGCKCGVRALFAIRPTTMTVKNRMQAFFGDSLPKALHLRSPSVYKVLEKRLSTNNKGEAISLDAQIDDINLTWRKLFELYKSSDTKWGLAAFVMSLCSTMPMYHIQPDIDSGIVLHDSDKEHHKEYDLRHYLRLFRRILRSNWLNDLENIKITYYGIQALMLGSDLPMNESESFLFNLFDNEEPMHIGNALIRYRVLEYAEILNDMNDDVFDNYFLCLGYSLDRVSNIINMFESAGLIEIIYYDDRKTKPKKMILTIPGRRHLEVVTNLWYIICAKTGMHIYEDYILYGDDARKVACRFVKSNRTLDYYSSHGWVPEDKFIDYIGLEEYLEDLRIGEFQGCHPEMAVQISNWMRMRSQLSYNLHYCCSVQLHHWGKTSGS